MSFHWVQDALINIFNLPYISVNTTYKFEFTATCFNLTSHLQPYLWTLTSYNLPVRIWDPRWLAMCVHLQRDSYVLLYLHIYWGWLQELFVVVCFWLFEEYGIRHCLLLLEKIKLLSGCLWSTVEQLLKTKFFKAEIYYVNFVHLHI